jgi:outer membrane protein OmpA-like peptidoglycan-associated protein
MRRIAVLAAAALACATTPALACMTAATVLFAPFSTTLTPAGEETLRDFAMKTQRSADWSAILLTGHWDAWESRTPLAALSQKRAETVRDYLMAMGVSDGLIRVRAAEAERSRTAPEEIAQDRRVDLYAEPAPRPAPPPGTPIPTC